MNAGISNQLNRNMISRTGIYLCAFLITATLTAQNLERRQDGFYRDGKLANGSFESFTKDGVLSSTRHFVDGKEDGISVYYFINGNKQEERAWKKGLKHGTWVTWSANGSRTAVANYEDDKKHGKWYIWDENGVLRYEMNYLEGERTGSWFMWDEDGSLVDEKLFD
jgi:antitoxin component YwqK of YwqJK toxin-antitoxin module